MDKRETLVRVAVIFLNMVLVCRIVSLMDGLTYLVLKPRQTFDIEDNDITPNMVTIIAEKLAANRAVRRDMTFLDCLRLKYPRVAPKPVVADPR